MSISLVSQTSIVNKALTLCGAAPITNITDDTPNARVANRVYEIARRSILCECLWTFAATRTSLTLSTQEMAWEYDDEAYVYVRPASALRIFGVSDEDAMWREEGDLIISDTVSLGVKFVYNHDNPSKWPGPFLEAFTDKLCSDICYMILNSGTKAEMFLNKYLKFSLPKAKSANSQTGTQQVPKDDAWLASKYANGGREDRSYG